MQLLGRVIQRRLGAVAVVCALVLIAGIFATARGSDTADELATETQRSSVVDDKGAGVDSSSATNDDSSPDSDAAALSERPDIGTTGASLGSKTEAPRSSAPPSTTRTAGTPSSVPTGPAPPAAPTTPPTTSPTSNAPPKDTTTTTTGALNSASAETEIHTFLNRQRAEHGLPALPRMECLNSMARDWSVKMLDADRLFHRTGLLADTGAYCGANQQSRAAENLGLHYSVAGLNKAWWASATHRENLLGAHWTEVGIGVARHPATGELFAAINFRTRS